MVTFHTLPECRVHEAVAKAASSRYHIPTQHEGAEYLRYMNLYMQGVA